MEPYSQTAPLSNRSVVSKPLVPETFIWALAKSWLGIWSYNVVWYSDLAIDDLGEIMAMWPIVERVQACGCLAGHYQPQPQLHQWRLNFHWAKCSLANNEFSAKCCTECCRLTQSWSVISLHQCRYLCIQRALNTPILDFSRKRSLMHSHIYKLMIVTRSMWQKPRYMDLLTDTCL